MQQWERVDWQYAKVLDIEATMKKPEIVALRESSMPRYQQKMAALYPVFFEHYTRIFMKVINGALNKQLYLMCLKQKQKIDSGEVDFETGNQEIIDSQVNRLVSKLPAELQGKIKKKYSDLKEEDAERKRKEEKEAEEIMAERMYEFNNPRIEVVEEEQ